MAKMIDLGEKQDVTEAPISRRGNQKKTYPTVYIYDSTKMIFTAEDVGKTFEIAGEIHVTGIDLDTDVNKTRKGFRFELRKMAVNNSRDRLKKALKKHKQ